VASGGSSLDSVRKIDRGNSLYQGNAYRGRKERLIRVTVLSHARSSAAG
jgi:hypothetical protein